MRIIILITVLLIFTISSIWASPRMRHEDKILIREAIEISNEYGDKIWKGINEVPFVVLLVSDSIEFLINHPYPSGDFLFSEKDTILNTDILYRPRQFPEWFLATFPAVNGVNCIVVGTPEKTNKSSTDWTITLLHEHFHQYQFSQPDYYNSVDQLGLSGGDETGMWQLNYAFPYDSFEIGNQYEKYVSALSKALSKVERTSFKKHFKKYLAERTKFKSLLPPEDYRYFSFQVWQEGIARYTEYKFLRQLEDYIPSKEMAQIRDFIPFIKYKDSFYLVESGFLANSKLNIDKRICFYPIGFAEGLLLDKLNPGWAENYFKDKFNIEKHFTE